MVQQYLYDFLVKVTSTYFSHTVNECKLFEKEKVNLFSRIMEKLSLNCK